MPGVGVLTEADVAELQRIMHEEYGLDLDRSAAWERATQLMNLYRMLLRPIPEDKPDSSSQLSSNVGPLVSSPQRKLR
jgi:hypothetical protein